MIRNNTYTNYTYIDVEPSFSILSDFFTSLDVSKADLSNSLLIIEGLYYKKDGVNYRLTL